MHMILKAQIEDPCPALMQDQQGSLSFGDGCSVMGAVAVDGCTAIGPWPVLIWPEGAIR